MARRRCEVCRKEINEYHVKIDGKYYHYSPCCIERFKTGNEVSIPSFSLDVVERPGPGDLASHVGDPSTHNLLETEGYSLSCSLFPTFGSYRNRLAGNLREDGAQCDLWSKN
jgi:hypothetical protein